MPPENATTYAQGHHASVLRTHSWRTAQNSAAYLLKHLRPTMHILDVGCGPGTITTSFAQLVPEGHVTGVDFVPPDSDMLDVARADAARRGITNVSFARGDVCDLRDVPDCAYDVVHCHQVLQHVVDPVGALREMRRVTKPGGLVAAREADARTFGWYPEREGMDEWMEAYRGIARGNGTEPDAGRKLVAWALEAGFERAAIDATAGTWCYSTPDERAFWAGVWTERIARSAFGTNAVDKGLADRDKLERMVRDWREWEKTEEGWFALMHGEIVCRV